MGARLPERQVGAVRAPRPRARQGAAPPEVICDESARLPRLRSRRFARPRRGARSQAGRRRRCSSASERAGSTSRTSSSCRASTSSSRRRRSRPAARSPASSKPSAPASRDVKRRRSRRRHGQLRRHRREVRHRRRRGPCPSRAAWTSPRRRAFPTAYGTTLHALRDRAQIATGRDRCSCSGAAGGVGLSAVQIGKRMGARVIAAASSAEKLAICKEHGADEVIDYGQRRPEGARQGADGRRRAPTWSTTRWAASTREPALRATAWEGRFLVIGFAAGDIPRVPTNLTLLKGCSIVGVFWGMAMMRDPVRACRGQLRRAPRRGPPTAASSRTSMRGIPSSARSTRSRTSQQRRVRGKAVVVVGGRRVRRVLPLVLLPLLAGRRTRSRRARPRPAHGLRRPCRRDRGAARAGAAPARATHPLHERIPRAAANASAAGAAADQLFAGALRAYHAALVAGGSASKSCGARSSSARVAEAEQLMAAGRVDEAIARLAELVEDPQFDLFADSEEGRAAVFRLGDALATAALYEPARSYLRRVLEAKGAWDAGGTWARRAVRRLVDIALESEEFAAVAGRSAERPAERARRGARRDCVHERPRPGGRRQPRRRRSRPTRRSRSGAASGPRPRICRGSSTSRRATRRTARTCSARWPTRSAARRPRRTSPTRSSSRCATSRGWASAASRTSRAATTTRATTTTSSRATPTAWPRRSTRPPPPATRRRTTKARASCSTSSRRWASTTATRTRRGC